MPPKNDSLIGSSAYPASIDLAPGVKITLGDLVMAANKRSKLTVDAWNALTQSDRDAELAATLVEMKAAAALPVTVKVKLVKAHTHEGKDYQAGDEIDVPPDLVPWLKRVKVVAADPAPVATAAS